MSTIGDELPSAAVTGEQAARADPEPEIRRGRGRPAEHLPGPPDIVNPALAGFLAS
jgi:hypothetical protein